MTSIPYLRGSADPDEIRNIATNLQTIFNPHYAQQQLLKQHLATDPTFRQKLIDAEAENPGTIAQMFGYQAAGLGLGNPSAEALQRIRERGDINKPVSELASEGTAGSERSMRLFTGVTSPQYSSEQSAAAKAKAEAGEIVATTPSATKLKISQITEAQRIADATLSSSLLETEVSNKASKAAQEAADRVLATSYIANWNRNPLKDKYKTIADALVDGAPMNEATRNALTEFPGIKTQYGERIASMRATAYIDRITSLGERQKADADDKMDRVDATHNASVYGKLGQPVLAQDLYQAHKLGLDIPGGILDQAIKTNPQRLQQMLSPVGPDGKPNPNFNPAFAALAQHPTMISTWQNYQNGLNTISDEKFQGLEKVYNATLKGIESSLKSKKQLDPSVAQADIERLQSDPYVQAAKARGLFVPTPKFGKTSIWSGPHLYYQDDKGQKVSSPNAIQPAMTAVDKASLSEKLHAKYPTKSPAEIKAMVEAGIRE